VKFRPPGRPGVKQRSLQVPADLRRAILTGVIIAAVSVLAAPDAKRLLIKALSLSTLSKG
jgi:hypothetical protein